MSFVFVEVVTIYGLLCMFVLLGFRGGKQPARDKKAANKSFYNISIPLCVFFAFGCTLINVLVTENSVVMGGDRTNYYVDYLTLSSVTFGLEVIFRAASSIGLSYEAVLYITTFICVLITMLALRNYRGATARCVAYLLSSNFVFSTFVNLKQCYACALSAMFFSISSHDGSRYRSLLMIILAILATLFHPTGYILIIFLLFDYLHKSKEASWGLQKSPIVLAILAAILFRPVGLWLSTVLNGVLPAFSSKLYQYLSSESSFGVSLSPDLLIKEIPSFSVLFLYPLSLRSGKRDNGDAITTLSVALGATFSVLSVVSYWMSRVTSLFYMPMGYVYGRSAEVVDKHAVFFVDLAAVALQLFFTLRSVYLVFALYGGY